MFAVLLIYLAKEGGRWQKSEASVNGSCQEGSDVSQRLPNVENVSGDKEYYRSFCRSKLR